MIRRRQWTSRSNQDQALYRARRSDALQISLRIVRENGMLYVQTNLQQRGVAAIFDTIRQPEMPPLAEALALRRSYEEQLRIVHELLADGLPMSAQALDFEPLYELGRRVAAILPLDVRVRLRAAVFRAQRRRRIVRLTLEVAADAQELLSVPWEFLVLPFNPRAHPDWQKEGFLLQSAHVALVRQVQGCGQNMPPVLHPPFRLQAFAATPEDGSAIDAATTRAAIARIVPPDTLRSCWYDGPGTLDLMQERLRQYNPQIVHLLCHGEQNDTGRGFRSDLLLTHRDGYTQRVSAFDLAPVLSLAPDLQIVVLQACDTGKTPLSASKTLNQVEQTDSERGAMESIALTLVRQGISTVVAMQGAVGQRFAAAFIQRCYQALAQGHPIEYAVAAGRIAMRAEGGVVDWSLPVVYQGSGQLEPEIWHARLADSVGATLIDPAGAATIRGGAVALVLILFTSGLLQWLFLPPIVPDLRGLERPLLAWLGVGAVGPAIIAAMHKGVRSRTDLSAGERRAVLRAQWMGAYIGYVLGGLVGMFGLAAFWSIGLVRHIPAPGPLLLFGAVLLWALFTSYIGTRIMKRSALSSVSFAPSLFDNSTLGLIVCGAIVLLVAPLGILLLPSTPLGILLNSPYIALLFSVALLSFVYGFRS